MHSFYTIFVRVAVKARSNGAVFLVIGTGQRESLI